MGSGSFTVSTAVSTPGYRNICIGSSAKAPLKKLRSRMTSELSSLSKTMLPQKDNRVAGELEGAKAPLEIRLIAIKNVRYGLFDERSEIFCEILSQKMWRF